MVIPSAGMYMVRAGEGGVMVARFLKDGVAYIGWGCVGPIAPTDGKAEIRRRLDMYNPAQGAGARPNIVGMLRRFCCEIRVGDVVVTYDPQMRQYHVGIVRSDAEIQMTAWGDGYEELGYVRSVDWARGLRRDCLSRSTRNGLNGQLSCFKVSAGVRREIVQFCSALPGVVGTGSSVT